MSSSERNGRLEKQVQFNSFWQNNDEQTVIHADKILELIGEAKKAFPSDKEVRSFDDLPKLAKTWEELVGRYIKLTAERNAWFRFYFGESP